MLVLTRRVGEEIVIDGSIRVTIVSVNGHRVRLGIAAPPNVAVARSELLTRSPEVLRFKQLRVPAKGGNGEAQTATPKETDAATPVSQ